MEAIAGLSAILRTYPFPLSCRMEYLKTSFGSERALAEERGYTNKWGARLLERLTLKLYPLPRISNADSYTYAEVIQSVTIVAKRLNEVRESYNNVALHTTLVASQLSTIRAALEALYEWRSNDPDSNGPSRQLDEDLGVSVSCCAILISVIDRKLDDSGYIPGLKQKIRYLWLENTLREYVSNLEGQVRALQLLLTIFQCRTTTERRQKLQNEESRTIIEQVRAETASLTLDNQSLQDAASVLSLNPSVSLDIDSILLKSPAYQRVYGEARLRPPLSASASPNQNSEEAARPASVRVSDARGPPLPSRKTRKQIPRSRGRINAWDNYPTEQGEDKNPDGTIVTSSNDVFELSRETQESSAASPRKEEPTREQEPSSQREETSTIKAYGDSKVNGVAHLVGSVQEDKHLFLQTEKALTTALPATIDDTEPVSALKGFMNQLNIAFSEKNPSRDQRCDLGLLYGTALNLKAEESYTSAGPRGEATQAISRKGSKELGRHTNPQSEKLGVEYGRRYSSREEVQTPMSNHPSLYEVSKEQSTRTSSPYSCVSCRNIGATDHLSRNDSVEAEVHSLDQLAPQPEPGNILAQEAIMDEDLDLKIVDESQEGPGRAGFRTSPSSAHDATSTISSSEALENSTILNLQQSSSNPTTTSVTTHVSGLDQDQDHSDLRRLQNELTTTKETGDNQAIQDFPQQSIKTIKQKYFTSPSAKNNNSPTKFPSTQRGRAQSNIIRFPSLAGSVKGVALGDSAASGDTLSVQKMVKENVNVDARSDNFKTPLMRAAMNGHIECMEFLKQSGADELAVDARGSTALHLAVASNRVAVVKWMLEAYPPPKADPLRHRPSILTRATAVVKGVRSQKNLRETSDTGGSKPLHIAAELDRGIMLETLIAAGVDIESKDNWGRTSLHRAIVSKRRDSFDTLLRSGAKIAALDAKSRSSLHLAAQTGQVDMIETLLASEAKRWDFDADGKQPIHSAVQGGNPFAIEALVTERTDLNKRTKSGETLLHLACFKKDLEIAKYLLMNLIDINPWAAPSPDILQVLSHTRIIGTSMTPLHYACCMHDFEMALLLLDREALVNAPTPEGATALMMAVETEDTNLVNLLLQREAKVNAKIPGSLITALHLAARRGDLETVQQLCRHRADDGARTGNASGCRSPLEESMKCSDKKKGQAVGSYIRTVITNRINNKFRANARIHQANRTDSFQTYPTESSQTYYNPPAGQIAPLVNGVSYAPGARIPHGYFPDQGNVAQQAQAQSEHYCHPIFDVPDDILPPYEPGPSAPARFANQAPVYRPKYA